jgi:hypothetical protein
MMMGLFHCEDLSMKDILEAKMDLSILFCLITWFIATLSMFKFLITEPGNVKKLSIQD